ncbi:MAG: hypothetical protein ACR2LJ_10750 [Acidimicrobiales bacterium]
MGADARRASKEAQIRAAMERLLTHRAIHTDATLDVTTLAAEAGVARQDLYRTYRGLLEEFRVHVRRLEESGSTPDRRGAQIEVLKRRLAEAVGRAGRYRVERDSARHERDAAASQVAYVTEQNRLLREQLEAGNRVSSLPLSRQSARPAPAR